MINAFPTLADAGFTKADEEAIRKVYNKSEQYPHGLIPVLGEDKIARTKVLYALLNTLIEEKGDGGDIDGVGATTIEREIAYTAPKTDRVIQSTIGETTTDVKIKSVSRMAPASILVDDLDTDEAILYASMYAEFGVVLAGVSKERLTTWIAASEENKKRYEQIWLMTIDAGIPDPVVTTSLLDPI